MEGVGDPYNFNCAAFTDFDDGDLLSDDETVTHDGYFVSRPSDVGVEQVPAEWLAFAQKQATSPAANNGESFEEDEGENIQSSGNVANNDPESVKKPKSSTKKRAVDNKEGQQQESGEVVVDEYVAPISSVLKPRAKPSIPEELEEEVLDEGGEEQEEQVEVVHGEELLPPAPFESESPTCEQFSPTLASPEPTSAESLLLSATPETPTTTECVVEDHQASPAEALLSLHMQQRQDPPSSNLQTIPENQQVERKSENARAGVPKYLQPTKSAVGKVRNNRRQQDTSTTTATSERPKLTEPKTPFFATSQRVKRATNNQHDEAAAEGKRAEKKTNKTAQDVVTNRAVKKSLTKPESPAFVSASRPGALRKAEIEREKQAEEERRKKHSSSLASTSIGSKGPVRLTHPQPFHFRSDARIKGEQPKDDNDKKEEYVPLVVQVQKYQTKTPARFKRPTKNSPDLPKPQEFRLTEPHEPHFATDSRIRPVETVSSQQLEEQALKNNKPFKARPLNRKILESAGDLGVPKVAKKAPCVAKGFTSRTEERAASRRRPGTPGSTTSTSTAGRRPIRGRRATMAAGRPRSASQTSSQTSSSNNKPFRPTEVKAFSFATDARAARPRTPVGASLEDAVKPAAKFARKVPDFTKPPKLPQVERKMPVKPEPFKLQSEKRHEEARKKFEEQLHQQLEQEITARQFKARPIMISRGPPSPGARQLPEHPLTDPKTPLTLHRSETSRMEFERRKQELEAAEMQKHRFKARPLPETTFHKDFSPEHHVKITEVMDVHLNTESRAPQRAEFDKHMEEKLKLAQEEQERKLREQKEREEAEAREQAKKHAFKARPMPDYAAMNKMGKPVEQRPLTQPESPWLMTKQRAKGAETNAKQE